MRTLMKIQIPVEAGNSAIKDGTLPQVMGATFDRLKPETAYFYAEKGLRTAIFVFDLKEPSQIPVIAEPLFQRLNASVEMHPVMNADDLKAGLEALLR